MSDETDSDPTELARRAALAEMQAKGPMSREDLECAFGRVWNTQELTGDFEVVGFLAPLVVVCRRSDGHKGSLTFQHHPRLYFDFVEDRP